MIGGQGLHEGQCCIGRSARMTGRADENDLLSDGRRELVECCADLVAGGDVGGEFVVAAAQVLDERVPGGDDPRGLCVPKISSVALTSRLALSAARP